MDMHTKVKQPSVNMWKQMTTIFTPFFNFMNVFQAF
jgi:hypothetical protein